MPPEYVESKSKGLKLKEKYYTGISEEVKRTTNLKLDIERFPENYFNDGIFNLGSLKICGYLAEFWGDNPSLSVIVSVINMITQKYDYFAIHEKDEDTVIYAEVVLGDQVKITYGSTGQDIALIVEKPHSKIIYPEEDARIHQNSFFYDVLISLKKLEISDTAE